MPNFAGKWTLAEQMQAKGASTWTSIQAPTIGDAVSASATSASVRFTPSSCAGYPTTITGYTATSTPGCFTGTGTSSPITVSGLTTGTSYTFKVRATSAVGVSACSEASNSVTIVLPSQSEYTTPGTYSWVAPSNVTSVSVVAVGSATGACGCSFTTWFRGGNLRYRKNVTVVPGNSYTVVVSCSRGVSSSFNSTTLQAGTTNSSTSTTIAGCVGGGNGGGASGPTSCGRPGFGGAGGYSGNGGCGGGWRFCVYPGGAGSGGGGGGGSGNEGPGGGVNIYGQGVNGAGGALNVNTDQGRGGSGGANGNCGGAFGGGGYTPATGAVRIIWPAPCRNYPAKCTQNK